MTGKTQMFIDFGQKKFGISTVCVTCGMLYVLGVEEDEKRHNMHCKMRKKAGTLPTLSGKPNVQHIVYICIYYLSMVRMSVLMSFFDSLFFKLLTLI